MRGFDTNEVCITDIWHRAESIADDLFINKLIRMPKWQGKPTRRNTMSYLEQCEELKGQVMDIVVTALTEHLPDTTKVKAD